MIPTDYYQEKLAKRLRDAMLAAVTDMPVGQKVVVTEKDLDIAFKAPPLAYVLAGRRHAAPLDMLLNRIVGANFTIRVEPGTGDHGPQFTLTKMPDTGKRWNVDRDRRHDYRQLADGSWEHRNARSTT